MMDLANACKQMAEDEPKTAGIMAAVMQLTREAGEAIVRMGNLMDFLKEQSKKSGKEKNKAVSEFIVACIDQLLKEAHYV